jgi:hypothetical protein
MADGQLAKAFVLAKKAGLSRDDRIDLAQIVTGRDEIRSWSELGPAETEKVLDHLAGFFYVRFLVCEREGVTDE